MKEKVCFKKYKNSSILFSIILVIALCLCLLMGNAIGGMGAFLSVLGFGSVITYNLYSYFSYKKRAKDMTADFGRISNWKISGHHNRWACVALMVGDKEYCSPYYFSSYEAEEMMGKEVSFIIIDDTLLIYEILD